jgi:hypothetical protein
MLAIHLIPTIPDLRHALYFYMVERLYHGSHPKKTLVATSTNHSKKIAIYEASCEYVWLRRMINHIQQSCAIGSVTKPIIIYEDYSACIAKMNACYIKSNITKYIATKLFYPHKLQKNGEIEILQTKLYVANLFTKSLPTSLFQKYILELV